MRYCIVCGTQLKENSSFCISCGAKISQTPKPEQSPIQSEAFSQEQSANHSQAEPKPTVISVAAQTVQSAKQLLGNTLLASETSGEMSFMPIASPTGAVPNTLSPIKCLAGGFVNIIKGIGAGVKDKKKLITALVMAVTWIVLTLLPLLGVNAQPIRWLSFFTLASGGTTGGIAGIVGGVFAKGVFAFFITSLIIPLFTGKNPLKNISSGFGRLFGSFAVKSLVSLGLLLMGCGFALVAYNFLTGNNTLQNSMAGITAFLLSIKALSAKTGFLQRFTGALTAGLSNKTSSDTLPANRLLSGWTIGFALAIALSLIPYIYICYAVGAALIVVSAFLLLLGNPGKNKNQAQALCSLLVFMMALFLPYTAISASAKTVNSKTGFPYNDSKNFSYKVVEHPDITSGWNGSDYVMAYKITVRDLNRAAYPIVSVDDYVITFKNLPQPQTPGSDTVYLFDQADPKSYAYSKTSFGIKYNSSYQDPNQNFDYLVNYTTSVNNAVSSSSELTVGTWGNHKALTETNAEHIAIDYNRNRYANYSSGGSMLILLEDLLIPNGVFYMDVDWSAHCYYYCGSVWDNEKGMIINEANIPIAESYYQQAKQAAEAYKNNFTNIRYEVTKTPHLTEAGAGLTIAVTTNASGTAEETPVSMPALIVLGVAGLAAALAGVSGSGTASGESTDNETKTPTYKMYIYKNFGNFIRYNKPAVIVYARMAEVSPEGVETQRPDLTGQISIFSSDSHMKIGSPTLAGDYMGATVEAESVKGQQNPTDGVVSFQFNGEGGSFQNNVTFRLIGEPYIQFNGSHKDKVFMQAGSKSRYELAFTPMDFVKKPDCSLGIISDSAPFTAVLETNQAGNTVLVIQDNSEKKQVLDRFYDGFQVEIIAQNETEHANAFADIVVCNEGLLATFHGGKKEIKGSLNWDTRRMEETRVDFKLGLWDETRKELVFVIPKELAFTYTDEQRICELIGLEAKKDLDCADKDVLRYILSAKISFPSNKTIPGEFTAMCKLDELYEYKAEVALIPDIQEYEENASIEKEYQNCLYIINSYLPEDKRPELIQELEQKRVQYKYDALDYKIYRRYCWNRAHDFIMRDHRDFMREAAMWDDMIKICELSQYVGDVALEIALLPYGGPLAKFIITNAKNLLVTVVGSYMSKGTVSMDDIVQHFTKMLGSLDDVMSTTPGPTQYRKLAVWLACFFVYRVAWNTMFGRDAKGNALGWCASIVQAFKDLSVKALITGFFARPELIGNPKNTSSARIPKTSTRIIYNKTADEELMKPITDVADGVVSFLDEFVELMMVVLGEIKSGNIPL